MLVEFFDNSDKVGENGDVGVKVHDLLRSVIEEMAEHMTFDSRGSFDNIMLEKPAIKAVEIQFLCIEDPIELRGQPTIVASGWLVGDNGPQHPIGMSFPQCSRQNDGARQVAEREASETMDLFAHGRSPSKI